MFKISLKVSWACLLIFFELFKSDSNTAFRCVFNVYDGVYLQQWLIAKSR